MTREVKGLTFHQSIVLLRDVNNKYEALYQKVLKLKGEGPRQLREIPVYRKMEDVKERMSYLVEQIKELNKEIERSKQGDTSQVALDILALAESVEVYP